MQERSKANPSQLRSQQQDWWTLADQASKQHGVFKMLEATSAGVTDRQVENALRRGEIESLFPGVYRFVASPRTYHQQAKAAELAVPGSHISHESSAFLHRLDGFTDPPDPRSATIHVTVERGNHRLRDGLAIHRWRRINTNNVVTLGTTRCATIPASLIQLGVGGSVDTVRNAVIGALRSGMDPRWLEQTMTGMNRPGPTGLKTMKFVLSLPELQGKPVESVLEIVNEQFALEAGLPPLERQIEVQTEGGLKRIDAGIRAVKLGIESTSFKHHFGFEFEQSDLRRNLELAAVGWHLEYLTWWASRQPEVFAVLLLRTYLTRCEQFGIRAA